jgi:hypothetical protein
MGVAEYELPTSPGRNDELAPEDVTAINRPLYMLVVAGLLVALLFGLVAWFVLALRGESMPEGMAVLVGTVGGGLVGLLTGSKA